MGSGFAFFFALGKRQKARPECAFGFIVGNCEDMVCTIDDGRLMGDPVT